MADEVSILLSIGIGAIIAYLIMRLRFKIWYLETMNPRQQYELGREKKLIVNMTIGKRQFNGFQAGKYKVLLLYGDLASFSKPILHGKIEEMYMTVLAESLVGRRFVTKIERLRFFDFIFRRIPALHVKSYMVTGELISPQDVLDHYWSGDERDKALAEMRRRRLIDPKILWVKPYPPEAKLKEIMTGVLMVPDLEFNFQQQYASITATERETLIKMNTGIADVVKELILLERSIVSSITDPTHMFAMLIADRMSKVEGLGLEQLAEKGGPESLVLVARRIKQHKDEIVKALGEEVKPEEITKYKDIAKQLSDIEKRLKELEEKAVKPIAKVP